MKKMRWLILPGLLSVCLFLSNIPTPADQNRSDSPDRWLSVDHWVGKLSVDQKTMALDPGIQLAGKVIGVPASSIIISLNVQLDLRDRTSVYHNVVWRGTAEGRLRYEAEGEFPSMEGEAWIRQSGQGAVSGDASLRINMRTGRYRLEIERFGKIPIRHREYFAVPGDVIANLDEVVEIRPIPNLSHTVERLSVRMLGGEEESLPEVPQNGFLLTGNIDDHFSSHLGDMTHKFSWSLQPVGSISVKVRGPEETIEGLNSDTFTAVVTPHDTNVESYAWEANWPAGAGHRPEVNFENPNAESTRVLKASWFALPDSRWMAHTGDRCVYEIVAIVRINGAEYRSDPHRWTVRVESSGIVRPWPIWGEEWTIQVEVSADDGLWYVTGPGNFQRYAMRTHVDAPENSDFYDKVEAHEEHHVRQFHDIEPWASMWDVGTFYRTVLVNLPGQPSWRDMFLLAMDEVDDWDERQAQIYLEHRCRMEWEAFQVEYGVDPRYLEWRKQDVEATYGCRF